MVILTAVRTEKWNMEKGVILSKDPFINKYILTGRKLRKYFPISRIKP